nr:hypothetical protein [Parabacteroides goldsteinii]
MKTLTWQKPGQQNVAQELIKIIINYVAELRILTTISVEDGAVHAYHLDFHALQIAEIVEIPVCPDYLVPVKGKLSLRAPPVV